jgi:hypothetical protein
MDLQEFVKESLRQIVRGVVEAQAELDSAGSDGFINPGINHLDTPLTQGAVVVPGKGIDRRLVQVIEYDVAVVASKAVETKAGAGLLTVVSVGGGRESKTSDETTSRLKFAVPIVLPLHPHTSVVPKKRQ